MRNTRRDVNVSDSPNSNDETGSEFSKRGGHSQARFISSTSTRLATRSGVLVSSVRGIAILVLNLDFACSSLDYELSTELSSEMAVMLDSLEYSLHENNFGTSNIIFEPHLTQGLEFDLTPKGGKKIAFENFLVGPGLYRVEDKDALVPESLEAPSLMDLSSPSDTPAVLDTPAIIDSIVDVLPFRFNNPTVTDLTSPDTEMTPEAVNAFLGIDETERFQDLSQLLVERPIPTISCSPASPLASPTDSTCSDITQSSSTSLYSAASTSSETHFFALDFEVLGSGAVKFQQPKSEVGKSYVDKRKKNNIASRRSRLTRREREKDMEKQLSSLYDENVSLTNKVRNLEELVEQTKKIIMQAVARR